MKAQDLRIDNLVWNEVQNIAVKVDIKIIADCVYKKPWQPIPLTEEWLLKIGGKPLENGYWISVSNLKAELHFELFKNTDEIVTTLKSQFCDLILDRIYYVHQLQNLYFALTNEELEVKK